MRNFLNKLGLACLMAVSVIPASHAALSTEATAAITSVSTAVTDLEAAWWPIVAAVFVALTLIKLFRKFGNRAT